MLITVSFQPTSSHGNYKNVFMIKATLHYNVEINIIYIYYIVYVGSWCQ